MSWDADKLARALEGAAADVGHGTDLVLESVTLARWIRAEATFVIRWRSTRGYRLNVTTQVGISADVLTFGPETIRTVLLASAEAAARADIGDDTFRATLRKHRAKGTA